MIFEENAQNETVPDARRPMPAHGTATPLVPGVHDPTPSLTRPHNQRTRLGNVDRLTKPPPCTGYVRDGEIMASSPPRQAGECPRGSLASFTGLLSWKPPMYGSSRQARPGFLPGLSPGPGYSVSTGRLARPPDRQASKPPGRQARTPPGPSLRVVPRANPRRPPEHAGWGNG